MLVDEVDSGHLSDDERVKHESKAAECGTARIAARVDWDPPEASRKSVFTYAEPWMCRQKIDNMTDAAVHEVDVSRGQAHASNSSDRGQHTRVLRRVRKERPGAFMEKGILVGVRYVMI